MKEEDGGDEGYREDDDYVGVAVDRDGGCVRARGGMWEGVRAGEGGLVEVEGKGRGICLEDGG